MDASGGFDDGADPERETFRRLLAQARAQASTGDRAGFTSTVSAFSREVVEPFLARLMDLDDEVAELEALCDAVFPPPDAGAAPPAGSPHRLVFAADVLDGPWPTSRRTAALLSVVDSDDGRPGQPVLDALAEEAIAAPPEPARIRLLRRLLSTPVGFTGRPAAARVLSALHAAGKLNAAAVEAAFTADRRVANADKPRLGDVVFGDGDGRPDPTGFRTALREQYDELVWRLTEAPDPDEWHRTPRSPAPRGTRFVRRGLDLWTGRLPAAAGAYDGDPYIDEMVEFLCGAELTDGERTDLDGWLRDRPEAERQKVAQCRQAAADAAAKRARKARPGPAVHAVPDVEPDRLHPDGAASYAGSRLTAADPVSAALARAPRVFLALIDDDPEFSIARADLCAFLHVAGDGWTYELSLSDEVRSIVETGPGEGEDDLLEQQLAARPDVQSAFHADREWFEVKLIRPLPADEMLARYIDALSAAHREEARRRGIALDD
ncbi:hypothetical protein ACFFX1_17270 [Dactylosporangium sucinum]|uniref:Uncharacterized protein n=1 Tax=Dactylosporangium sucinum TaxID=1424081 RepID=A0A917U5S4_9ACTN|nr:hypothetical protein [Dactylosporangium sucinum]GGM57476.1 hypothetical protein GCM10007977_068920 [Dactylosporangium sucinum]